MIKIQDFLYFNLLQKECFDKTKVMFQELFTSFENIQHMSIFSGLGWSLEIK